MTCPSSTRARVPRYSRWGRLRLVPRAQATGRPFDSGLGRWPKELDQTLFTSPEFEQQCRHCRRNHFHTRFPRLQDLPTDSGLTLSRIPPVLPSFHMLKKSTCIQPPLPTLSLSPLPLIPQSRNRIASGCLIASSHVHLARPFAYALPPRFALLTIYTLSAVIRGARRHLSVLCPGNSAYPFALQVVHKYWLVPYQSASGTETELWSYI